LSGMPPMTMANQSVLVSIYTRYELVNTLALKRWRCWN